MVYGAGGAPTALGPGVVFTQPLRAGLTYGAPLALEDGKKIGVHVASEGGPYKNQCKTG